MDRDAPSRDPGRDPEPVAPPSDEELMARYRNGEAAAFDQLLDRHKRPLYAYLRRSTRSSADADDLFQEVFVKVIRAAPTWREEARLTTWLYTIARNCLIDAHRKRHTGPLTVALEGNSADPDGERSPIDVLGDPRPLPDAAALAKEHGDAVEALVAGLPPAQREAFLLKREGLTFEEIAAVTESSKNTAKSRLRYALEKLREGLLARGLLARGGSS